LNFRRISSRATTILAMESQDLEEALGNLVENAAKFARARVVVQGAPIPAPGAEGSRLMIRIDVDDDGPGLDAAGMAEADEARAAGWTRSKPGTGLGLSIVGEIAIVNIKGSLALARAEMRRLVGAADAARRSRHEP
jgi:signal transduction histidine kinase